MESVWFKPELSDAIMQNHEIFDQTTSIVTDVVTGHIALTQLVENMSGVLTHAEPENRVKGMRFYTKILKEIPRSLLTDLQVQFIAKFYTDRLKDHHSVIPTVLEGFLAIIEMKHYNVKCSAEFLAALFREVSCQSQLRQDRFNIYLIIQKLLEKDVAYCKHLGPDLVYGMISAMDSERDPRNLLYLFKFLPYFMQTIPIGHLVEEMFDVISCYFPIDFHPSADDPAAVTRDDLANALRPCLCAIPEFAEPCLVMLIEKLDSSLRIAKLDSLALLTESCSTFDGKSYGPFLKALWSSINREINHKTDDEIKMASHEALSALIAKLATIADIDSSFEDMIKNILVTSQTAVADAKTVAQFVQTSKVLLTAANASKESCAVITRCMVPSTIAYYGFKTTSPKLQIASLDFLGDLYDLVKRWDVKELVEAQVTEIPHLCLAAASKNDTEFQIAGFKTLIRVKDILKTDLVLPFVEILTHYVQHSHDTDVLSISVETIHAIARKYPELIMNLVVRGNCKIDHLSDDKVAMQKRLHLLTNLASIDEFTKVIIEDILKLISAYDKGSSLVVEALNESFSMASFYTSEKVVQIESDHGLVEPILTWLYKEIQGNNEHTLTHGYTLVSNTISNLPPEKQEIILSKHTQKVLDSCQSDEKYFLILESLYCGLHAVVYTSEFQEIMELSIKMALNSENEFIRTKACVLIAHLLNKVEDGEKFKFLYNLLKKKLTSSCSGKKEEMVCPRIIHLYGWLTKALLLRGNDLFLFWLQKIVGILPNPLYSKQSCEAIRIIMTEFPDYLSPHLHCHKSVLYKQRMFLSFSNLASNFGSLPPEIKEDYLLSWAYVLAQTPKPVLNSEAAKVSSIVIDSLDYKNVDLLRVSLDILAHLVHTQSSVSESLQTILPRVVKLTTYVKSMDVRIKSLECLYDIANTFRTSLLLPFKQDMLIDLAPSLDDKKRLVRNKAVRARTRWFLVGAPGEEKVN